MPTGGRLRSTGPSRHRLWRDGYVPALPGERVWPNLAYPAIAGLLPPASGYENEQSQKKQQCLECVPAGNAPEAPGIPPQSVELARLAHSGTWSSHTPEATF